MFKAVIITFLMFVAIELAVISGDIHTIASFIPHIELTP